MSGVVTMQRNTSGQQALGLSLVNSATKSRVPRYPKHTFNLVQYPYEITPFLMAPVLAGETVRNLLLQCRTVSTGVENALIGHHLEHYFFYVRLRDMVDEVDLVAMLMDPTATANVNKKSGASVYKYVGDGAVDWVTMALDAVVAGWFRDEGDTGSHVGATTGLPMAMWSNYQGIAESLIDDSVIKTDTSIPTAFPMFEKEYETWMFLRNMQMTESSFEDYLGSFGVVTEDAVQDRPELLRMTKTWAYPANTVDGATGAVNSQLSFSIQERADKDRFIKEPGFIMGVTIARPKVYVGVQDQAAISVLSDAFAWLPAMMKEMPESSLKKIAGNSADLPWTAASTPSGGQLDSDNSYWVDVRDLFLYGDQFVNRTQGADVNNAVAPENLATMHGKKYPSSASLQLIGKSDVLTYQSDGIVSLNILGTQVEST